MTAVGPSESDWDYDAVARGELGDEDYSPDAWVRLRCEVEGCDWGQDADWGDLEESPPAAYRAHWAQKHGSDGG